MLNPTTSYSQLRKHLGGEARRFREVFDEGHTSGDSADAVRGIVREAPLLALASAFLVGFMFARR
jgi:hypothetical protein